MPQNKKSIVIVAVLAAFLPPFMAAGVNVALPAIGSHFGLPVVALPWLITSYLLTVTVFLVPFGKVGDLHGRRNLFLLGTVLFTAASLLCALAPSVLQLFAARILQGVGGAMIFGTSTAMLTAVAAPHERGKLLGISVSSTYLGLSLGPTLGGLLTQYGGWQWVFYSNVIVGLVIIAIVVATIKPDKPVTDEGKRFDVAGSLVYGASLIALMIGLAVLPAPSGIALSVAGVAGCILFAVIEGRIQSPVLDISLLRNNPVFLFSNIAALFIYSAAFGSGFLMSLYLQCIKGFSPRHAGLIMVTQPLLMTVFSPLAGRLSDKTEPRILASAGMALTAAGLFLFCSINMSSSLPVVLGAFAMIGIGMAFFSSPNMSAVMSAIEKQHYGTASAIVGTMRLLGQVLSISIAALFMSASLGTAGVISAGEADGFITSARSAYLVFGLLCTIGVAASLARGRMKR